MAITLRTLLIVAVLAALGGEGYFVVSTRAQLRELNSNVARLQSENASSSALVSLLASSTDMLALRTKAIEIVATKEIAGFQIGLAAAQREQATIQADLRSAQSTIASEQRARQLAEAANIAENLRASAEIIALQKQLTTSISTNDLSSIIETWRPRVAKVTCRFSGGSSSSGSGTVMLFSDETASGVGVLTNRHVIRGGVSSSRTPINCDVSLPGSGVAATAYAAKSQIQVDSSGTLDFGRLLLDFPPAQFAQVAASKSDSCSEMPKLGETLLILGYPTIGSTNDITVTDGIISGFDTNYFITSAKVERGNSGGAAVLVKNKCLLGVPTFVLAGGIESLARILDIRAIK